MNAGRFAIVVGMAFISGGWIVPGQGYGNESLLQRARMLEWADVEVVRSNGTRFQGRFHGSIQDGCVLLQKVGDHGEVEVELRWPDVAEVRFASEPILLEAMDLLGGSEHELAMTVLWELYEQHSPFFPVMKLAQIEPYLQWAERAEATRTSDALGVLRGMHPQLEHSALSERIDQSLLRCYLNLSLWNEAEALARQRIESSANPGHASLEWIALSVIELQQNRNLTALRCAVHALIFHSHPDTALVRHASLLASLASLRLKRFEDAHRYRMGVTAGDEALRLPPYLHHWMQVWSSVDWRSQASEPLRKEEFNPFALPDSSPEHANDALPVPRIPFHSVDAVAEQNESDLHQ